MSFNAMYNTSTGEIEGAKPFSYSWFHEKRHQEQFNTIRPLKTFNQYLEVYTYALCSAFLFSTIVGFIPKGWALLLMGASVVPYSFLNLVLEIDAFIFGSYRYFKHLKG